MADRERVEDVFGEIVIERDIATPEQVAAFKKRRSRISARGKSIRLGEIMMQKGIITKEQALDILKEAHRRTGDKPRIGGYELDKTIGKGAMGAVYKARQISMDRIVALKLLPRRLSRDANFVKRFMREARMCARLNHPNIVSAIDVGESNGYHYFAMEFVEGKTLERVLKREKRIPEDRALTIAAQIVQGLQHAASHGIVHRDIKPANIMICKDGTVKLADMGLAVARDAQSSSSECTSDGVAVGTPYYMAPEQVEGRHDVDHRADIYALGATLFEAVTGQRPWQAANVPAIMARRLYESPPLAHETCGDVSVNFSAVIRKMMSRIPEDRYQTLDALLDDLHAVAEGGSPAAGKLAQQRSRRSKRQPRDGRNKRHGSQSFLRNPTQVVLFGAGVVILIGILLAAAGLFSPPQPRHPHPDTMSRAVWEPYQVNTSTPGDKVRDLWESARNLHNTLEHPDASEKTTKRAVLAAYKRIFDEFPNSAYSVRAKVRYEKLNK